MRTDLLVLRLSNKLEGVPPGLTLGRGTDNDSKHEMVMFGTRAGVVRAWQVGVVEACVAHLARCGSTE